MKILNDKFEQCPNCKTYNTKRYGGIDECEERECQDCKCRYWRSNK